MISNGEKLHPVLVSECVSSGVHQYEVVNHAPVYVTAGPFTIQVMLAMPIGLKQVPNKGIIQI